MSGVADTAGAVLVTGATGNVGAVVVRHLLERGEPVVSAVRDLADPGLVPGSEARAFDFENPSGWQAALAGIDRVFLLRPPAIGDVQQHLLPFVDLALEHGVRHVVFLSLQGVQVNRATPHHAVEKHLRARKAPFTFPRRAHARPSSTPTTSAASPRTCSPSPGTSARPTRSPASSR